MATITVSLYPNVPQLPGVPQLVRSLSEPADPAPTIGQSAQDALETSAAQAGPTWGIFQVQNDIEVNSDSTISQTPTLVQVVFPDNVYSFDNRNEWNLLDFPVQNGAFASYNKVIKPFEVSVRLTKGGSLEDRTQFLASIANIAGDFNLYTVVTPERSYPDVNIERYEVSRRSSEGAYFLEVDIFLRQILQVDAQYSTSAANTSNAQNPAAQPVTNQGIQQPAAAPPGAASDAADALSQAPL